MSLSSTVTFLLLALFLLNSHTCGAAAIRDSRVSSEKFSPYYAAFSDESKKEIQEYERLKRQLMKLHAIDWNVIADVKAFESSSD